MRGFGTTARAGALALLGLAACGGDDFDADRLDPFSQIDPPPPLVVDPEPPAAPAAPIAPRDLPPEWTPEDCPAGEAHFAFEDGCRRISTECEGTFAPGLPSSGVIYVDPTVQAGGDGSRASPLESLDDALAQAPDGGTIALANRIFFGGFRTLTRPVRIVGACTEQTIVGGFLVEAQDVLLENLKIAQLGTARAGSATVSGALLGGAVPYSVLGVGGALHLDDVYIGQVNTTTTSSIAGGVVVGAGHRLTGHNVVIEQTQGAGMVVLGSTTSVRLDGLAIRNIRGVGLRLQRRGVGVLAYDGAQVALSSVAMLGTQESAVLTDSGARIRIEDGLLFDNQGSFQSTSIVQATGNSQVELRRVRIGRGPSHGIEMLNGARLIAEDLTIEDIGLEEDGAFGAGVGVYDGATAAVRRVEVRGLPAAPDVGWVGYGLRLEGSASRLDAEDVFVAGVERGLDIHGGEVFVRRARIEQIQGIGAHVVDGVQGRLEDLDIFDTVGNRGLEVRFSTVELERIRLVEVREAALYTIGSSIFARDVDIHDPRPSGTGDALGMVLLNESDFDGRRVHVDGSAGVGVIMIAIEGEVMGGHVRLADLAVRNTRRGEQFSIGLAAVQRYNLELEDFLLEDNDIVGLHVAAGAALQARHGLIRNHSIGLNIFDEAFDPTGVADSVRYRGNRRNVQSLRIVIDISELEP